ncbi:MAG: hypothetical protein Q4F54_01610 [Coriobacteriia bacterium]|nr:hypothetical protein [Coriobacteriia bacterium]
MSKTKINLKLIIALLGVALVMCLVPLGVQALATDEATDAAASNNEGEPAVPANDQEYTIVNQKEGDTELGQLITRREDRKFTLADSETVYAEVNGPIGYLYVNHLDGSKTCVAAAFSDVIYNENLYKFKE